jgi:hypothetical protein
MNFKKVSAYTDTISFVIKNCRQKSDGIVIGIASEAESISSRIEEKRVELEKFEAELKSVQQTIKQ